MDKPHSDRPNDSNRSKVGIVTLHKHNFGSVLQAFSTQETIRGLFGINCEVLELNERKIMRWLRMVVFLLCHFFHIKEILRYIFSSRRKTLRLSKPSLKMMESFCRTHINEALLSRKELRTLSQKSEWAFAISGSDQVWNPSQFSKRYLYFLRFMDKKKRVAFAPSFGIAESPSFAKGMFKRFISEFEFLSAREQSGIDIMKRYGLSCDSLLYDPAIMIQKERWRDLYRDNGSSDRVVKEKYVLFFFIDEMEKTAAETICGFLKNHSDLKMVSFGYHQDSYYGLDGVNPIDGGPFDFLFFIDHAEFVFTDSFHATLFSLIFNRPFAVFNRSYSSGQDQSSRISNLLKLCNQTSRFNPDPSELSSIVFGESDAALEKMRESNLNYLTKVFNCYGIRPKQKKNVSVFGNSCYKCGLCKLICPSGAILSLGARNGLPIIDDNRCIKCGMCVDRCIMNKTFSSSQRASFIARGRNELTCRKSSSGGIFATIAESFLERDGYVCGAMIDVENHESICTHVIIHKKDDLPMLQGSKYVQSSAEKTFPKIKDLLDCGEEVLFCGLSCQVAALKSYLKKNYERLFTIDLVCHGAPNQELLVEYLEYLEKKEGAKISSLGFRNEDVAFDSKPYVLKIEFNNKKRCFSKAISLRRSSYYRMFMASACLKSSCYKCAFSNAKVGDITLGDYFLRDNLSEEAFATIGRRLKLSSVIINTVKGELLFNSSDYYLINVSNSVLKAKHPQLNEPVSRTRTGAMFERIYNQGGIKKVQKIIGLRNFFFAIPSFIRRVIKRG